MAEAWMNCGFDMQFPRLVRVEISLKYLLSFIFNDLENVASEEKSPAFRSGSRFLHHFLFSNLALTRTGRSSQGTRPVVFLYENQGVRRSGQRERTIIIVTSPAPTPHILPGKGSFSFSFSESL